MNKTSKQLISENKKLKFERDEAISDLSCNNEFFNGQLCMLKKINRNLTASNDFKLAILVLFAFVIVFL